MIVVTNIGDLLRTKVGMSGVMTALTNQKMDL